MDITRRSGTGDGSCPRFREALSARLDGEDPGMADEVIDAHLSRCADCRRFAEVATQQHGRSRIRPAASVPDLTGPILAQLSSERAGRDPYRPTRRPLSRSERPSSRATRHLSRPTGYFSRASGNRQWAPRRSFTTVGTAVVVAAAAFAGGGLLSTHLDHSSRAPSASGGAVVRQVAGAAQSSGRYPGATVMTVGVPKPAVALTDTAGRSYDLATETGRRVTLVYFGYTHCPDLCPINMALTAAALRDMPAAERHLITVVFITTDPGRDTPRVIRAWLDRFDPSFVGLTGSEAAIHAAEMQVQMPLSYPEPLVQATETGQDYRVVHAGYTLVYSQDGHAHLTVDDSARPDQFAVTLEHVLSYGYRGTS